MLDHIRSDIYLYVFLHKKNWLILFLTKQGLWAILQYRVSHWVNSKIQFPGIRQILKIFCSIWQKLIEIVAGIELPSPCEIGKGLYIPHAGGIVLHPNVKIGDYCTLSQDVTIGEGGRGEKKGTPKLGDRVYIAPGARIFGPITIGNDVAIGANAVVTKDLPDNAVAVGIPAKIISYQGSQDFVHYREKEQQINCS
jgi:serine O-acetyltransferase